MTSGDARRPWDCGLQPERTALAWQRTGLAMLGCSVALAAIDKRAIHIEWLLSTLLVAGVAVWIVAFGQRRYQRGHLVLVGAKDDSLPDGMVPAVTAAGTVVLGLVALATRAAGRHRGGAATYARPR